MGIRNRDGALFMATGVDNSGLYAGRREAMGIIKAMASEITSFDIFSGIGISAATAFASAAKSSYDFEKEFRKNMLEVATISTQVEGSMTDFMNQVMAITQQVPIKAPDAAKALYQIVSAGHDGAAGMNVLEVAAKSAVGGITDTVTAADAITTLLNAYKLSADDAEKVSDQLFTTARLGKTTFGELGQSIAQVAPIAAAYGVEMDQVLAAVATLTKSGTPTAQAMTQIRASIIGTSKVLGDGAFDSMTFQEALAEIANRAGGSEAKLRELIPEVEAVNGVLGMTGIKAQDAAEHLNAMNQSAGATEAAFNKMQEDVGNQMILLSNNIQAALRPMGSAILKNVSEAAQVINKGFETGQIQSSMETLQKLLVAVAGAFVTYKSAAIGASTAEALHSAKVTISNNLKSLQSQITGEAALSKEKERIHLEAYTTSLEKSITEEQRAKLAKMDLKASSQEYMKALSEQALQEKKNADNQVESLTKVVNKNKEKLSSAQENLEMSHQAVEAAKIELKASIEANDSIGFEVAQTKMNAAAQREEAASTNVSVASKKLKSSETRLVAATTAAEAAATRVNTATTVADTAVTNIATTAKSRLKVATIALWGAMKANPLGAVLTAVSLAATVYMVFADKVKAAETAQSRLNKLNKAAAESIADEKAELMLLLSVAKNELVSKEDRTKAIKKLNDISPEYLGNLSLENLGTKEATQSIDAYTKAIEKNARMMAAQDMVADKFSEQLKIRAEIEDLEKKKKINPNNKVVGDSFGGNKHVYAGAGKDIDYDNELKKKKKSYDDLQKEIDQVFSYAQEKIEKQPISIPVNIQIESEQANVAALLKKKEEIDTRINENKSNGLFVNALDQALLATVNKELTDTNNKLIALNKEAANPVGVNVQAITKEIEAATTKVSTLKQELSDLRSGKTSVEAGKTVKEVIEGKVKDLKAAEDALSTLTGQTTKETDKLLKTQSDLSRAILESELKLQAERIAIMEAGKDKRVLLVDQEYKETLAAIEKERAEYKKGVKESGGKEDPSVLGTFDTREGAAKDKRNTDVGNINKESVKEFADHQKQLSEILLSEEEKRLSSIKERYDKEREWANDQLKTGGMDKEQHEAYTININEAEAQESLKSLLDKYQDYDAKRREIDQRYTEEVQTLSSQRTETNKTEVDAAIAEAQKRHKEEVSALNFDEFKDTDLWNKMFGDLDKMALPTLQGILDKAKEVNTSTWSPENIKEYQDAITRLEESVRTRSPFKSIENDWKKLLKALKEGDKDAVAGALDGIDQAVQKINADLKTVAGGIGDIFGDEAGYAAEQVTELTSALGGFVTGASKFASGDILGGIASVVSSIGSIFSMGKKVKEMNREAREENQKFYDEAKAGEIEYQAMLRERLRITRQIGETSLQYFDRLQKELHAQSGSIGKEYEEVWSKLMGEEYISGKGYKHGTWFRKAKTWDEYGSLAGKSYEDIESLYTQNKLTDSAKVLFEQLQKLKDEGADVVDMMDDLNQSMKESWTGTTEDSIAQSILDGIAAGKNGVDDLTTYFRDMMKKAMLQGVNMKYLQEPIKKFYEQFADMSESGGMLTEGEIKQLEEMYQQIVNNAQAQFDNLQKVSGLDFSKDETSDNSLKGAYAKASQESIDLLAGQTGAQRVAIEDIRNNMQPIREQMQAIRDMNSRGWEDVKAIRDLTDKVEKNTERIAYIAEKIDGSMSEIGKDTRRSADALDGGTINAKVKM